MSITIDTPTTSTYNARTSPEDIHLLLTVSKVVNQSLDPQEVAEVALQLAMKAVNLNTGTIVLFQEQRPIILASHGFSPDWLHKFHACTLNLENTLIETTIQRERPRVFSNLDLVATDPVAQLFQQAQQQSLICLPLQTSRKMLGVMILGGRQQRLLPMSDVDFLQALVTQISIGLHNAWLFSQSQRHLEELESVAQMTQTLTSTLDSQQILVRLMEEITTRLNTEAAALLLLDAPLQELEFVAVAGPRSEHLKGVRLPVGHGIVGWVAQHNQSLLVPDVRQDERHYQGLDEDTEIIVRSVLCVPLQVRGQVIGVVEAINKKVGQFSKDNQRLLESQSCFAAIAIENARAYEEAQRQMQQAILYAQDLNTTYKQEREQRETVEKLRYSFLNVVGHELKTPLTAMLQGLEVLKNPNHGILNSDQIETVDMLTQQSKYLHRMIDGLSTFASFSAEKGAMRYQPVPFENILSEILTLSEFKARRKQIILEDRQLTPLPTLLLDKERMLKALLHLVDNAIKFSAAGSRVQISSNVEDEQLIVQIIDEGCGIPADQIDQIWDSFIQMNTTLKRGLEGLGLGLALTRYIVEGHGGTISVKSKVDRGSVFTIQIPCSSAN